MIRKDADLAWGWPTGAHRTQRTVVVGLFLLLLAGTTAAWAAPGNPPTPNSQEASDPLCPPQYVCLSVAEARAIAHDLNELDKLRALTKIKKSHIIGLGLAVGPTVVTCAETSGACLGATFGIVMRF